MTESKRSDRDDFEALVRGHQAQVCAVAYARLRDRGRAEEVAQDAFLIAWRDRSSSPMTVAWICGIARNLARNAARRRKETPMPPMTDPATTTPDARDELISREDLARANAALASLPDRDREAITLYYGGDESIAGVATALGISAEAARQRVHRGRKRLRDLLVVVETTLRTTRPTAAFTAAVVAAWTIGKPPPAHASTLAKLRAVPLATKLAVTALVIASSVAIGIGVAHTRHTVTDPRASVTSRFVPSPIHPRSLPPNIRVLAPPSLPTVQPPMVNLDFAAIPFLDLIALLRTQLQTPIWVAYDTTQTIDAIHTHGDIPAIDALDRALDAAAATRTEVAAIRIVPGGRTDASTFTGELVSLTIRDMPLNAVLTLLEPKLGMPIGRLGDEALGDDSTDHSPPITLDVHDVPAGVVLERALVQANVGYELTTGFVILPR